MSNVLKRAAPLPTSLAAKARVTGTGLIFWAAVQVATFFLARSSTVLALVQAALAEWGAGRVGITWSDALAPPPTSMAIARRAALGAAWGAGAAATVLVVALAMHTAARVPSAPSAELLAVGLFASALSAVRDELLLRGMVLRVTSGLLPTWAALLACGAAAVAARFGTDGPLLPLVALSSALRGISLAGLWMHDRGVWAAWAASTAWTWTLGSLAQGGIVDVSFASEPEGTWIAVSVLGAAALLAALPRRTS